MKLGTKRNIAGFSLGEVMIALSISAIVLAGGGNASALIFGGSIGSGGGRATESEQAADGRGDGD